MTWYCGVPGGVKWFKADIDNTDPNTAGKVPWTNVYPGAGLSPLVYFDGVRNEFVVQGGGIPNADGVYSFENTDSYKKSGTFSSSSSSSSSSFSSSSSSSLSSSNSSSSSSSETVYYFSVNSNTNCNSSFDFTSSNTNRVHIDVPDGSYLITYLTGGTLMGGAGDGWNAEVNINSTTWHNIWINGAISPGYVACCGTYSTLAAAEAAQDGTTIVINVSGGTGINAFAYDGDCGDNVGSISYSAVRL